MLGQWGVVYLCWGGGGGVRRKRQGETGRACRVGEVGRLWLLLCYDLKNIQYFIKTDKGALGPPVSL